MDVGIDFVSERCSAYQSQYFNHDILLCGIDRESKSSLTKGDFKIADENR